MITLYISNPCIYNESDKIDISFIPSLIRRRMSQVEKISAWLYNNSQVSTKDYKTVFSSNHGEWQTTSKLIEHYHYEKEFLPSKFSTSVHNAFCGILSILTKNRSSYTAIASGEDSIENGIIEAVLYSCSTLFIYADESTPTLYQPYLKTTPAKGLSFFISLDKINLDSKPVRVEFINQSKTLMFQEASDFLLYKSTTLTGKHLKMEYI